MNPSLFSGSKLASWGISWDKTLGDERWALPCGSQHHSLNNFTLEIISLEWFAFGLRVKGVLRTVYWWKICPVTKLLLFAMGDWGMIPLYPVKTRYKLATPYSLLSTGKTREMGTKGVPAEIQKPEVVTPKRADNHSGLINKFVLPLQSLQSLQLLPSSSTEQCPTTYHYWRSVTELQTTVDPWSWLSPSCFL